MMTTLVKISLQISSPAFKQNGTIQSKFTCEGENVNPPLFIEEIPPGTKSLAIIMDDPDAPVTFVHWICWNIPPTESISEDSAPGMKGKNSFGSIQYKGPCPPVGTHRYFFKVYALDAMLELKKGADKKALVNAMKGHILTSGELMGTYRKSKGF